MKLMMQAWEKTNAFPFYEPLGDSNEVTDMSIPDHVTMLSAFERGIYQEITKHGDGVTFVYYGES